MIQNDGTSSPSRTKVLNILKDESTCQDIESAFTRRQSKNIAITANSPEKAVENGSFFSEGKPAPKVVFSTKGRLPLIPSRGNESGESDGGNLRSPTEGGVKEGQG